MFRLDCIWFFPVLTYNSKCQHVELLSSPSALVSFKEEHSDYESSQCESTKKGVFVSVCVFVSV